MAGKLTVTLVVLFGLLALGSSRPSFEDEESFANEEEAERYFGEEEAFEQVARQFYDEAEAELKSQLQETRRSQERPPILLKWSSFCQGKRDGNYADVSNPRAFYMCDKAGQTWTMNCQAGLVYDHSSDRCEWANGASSSIVKDTSNNYQPPPPPPPVYPIYGNQPPNQSGEYGRK